MKLCKLPLAITDKNNEIHMIHFSDEEPYYYKARLADLVPMKILELNRKKI